MYLIQCIAIEYSRYGGKLEACQKPRRYVLTLQATLQQMTSLLKQLTVIEGVARVSKEDTQCRQQSNQGNAEAVYLASSQHAQRKEQREHLLARIMVKQRQAEVGGCE